MISSLCTGSFISYVYIGSSLHAMVEGHISKHSCPKQDMTFGLRLIWGCGDRGAEAPAIPAIALFDLTAGGGPVLMVVEKHD